MGLLKGLFGKAAPLAPTIIHKRVQGSDPNAGQVRLHLRIEPGGAGVLVINAAKVLHLNPTAAEFAKGILEDKDDAQILRSFLKRWKVGRAQAAADLTKLREQIQVLASDDDVCPVTYLDVERIEPFSTPVSAPHRMDLALTYNCDVSCGHCYVGRDKAMPSLDLAQWKRVLDKLWQIGVPHICFTGGEATLSPHLVQLVEHAENLGQVTGLLSNGCRLADEKLVQQLIEAGLDHVQITIESHDPAIHDAMVNSSGAHGRTVQGIRNALAAGLYLLTNTTLTRRNVAGIGQTIDFLAELGVKQFACNGIIHAGSGQAHPDALAEAELPALLERIRDLAIERGLRFIWYTPTQYCTCNPIQLELGVKACTAGTYNMCIEPDGAVIPCQSYYESVGNILEQPWEKIWNHPLLTSIRKREFVEDKCRDCADLSVCGGGCPLYVKTRELLCAESGSNAG